MTLTRELQGGASATIAPGTEYSAPIVPETPSSVPVADTEVQEAAGRTLDFVVTVDPPPAHDMEIWYRPYLVSPL